MLINNKKIYISEYFNFKLYMEITKYFSFSSSGGWFVEKSRPPFFSSDTNPYSISRNELQQILMKITGEIQEQRLYLSTILQ